MRLAYDERFLIVNYRGRILVIDLLLEVVERPIRGSDGTVAYMFPDNVPDAVKRTVASLL